MLHFIKQLVDGLKQSIVKWDVEFRSLQRQHGTCRVYPQDYYNEFNVYIILNSDTTLNNPAQMLETAVHEACHVMLEIAYEYGVLDHPGKDDNEILNCELTNYVFRNHRELALELAKYVLSSVSTDNGPFNMYDMFDWDEYREEAVELSERSLLCRG